MRLEGTGNTQKSAQRGRERGLETFADREKTTTEMKREMNEQRKTRTRERRPEK